MKILHATEIAQAGVVTHMNALLPLQACQREPGAVMVYLPAEHQKNLVEDVRNAVKVETYDRGGRNPIALYRFIVGLLRLAWRTHPDIVHFHSTFAGALGRICRPFFPRKTRIVYCPHGWAFCREDSALARWCYRKAEAVLSRFSDAWVAVSRHEHAVGVAAGLSTIKGVTIRYGLADTVGSPTANGVWPRDRINLLFVGRFDRQKGLDVLFKAYAAAANPDLHLYLAGANILDAHMTVQEKPVGMTFLGWCNATQLDQYYAECDAVVLPSRWEGLPLVGLEALRAGCAIIGSTRCSVPELIEEGENGYSFKLENVESLVQILRGLDKNRLQKLGERSRAIFLEQFQVGRMHAEMEALYARICGASPGLCANE